MSTLFEYILIFLAAATPWLEAIIIVPIGIIRGLNPIIISVVAFVGNLITILLIVIYYEWFEEWFDKFKAKKGFKQKEPTKRHDRAKQVWNKYGLPGLSFGGPLLLGTHFTIITALALGSNKKAATWWMIISLASWIITVAIGTYYGFSWIKYITKNNFFSF